MPHLFARCGGLACLLVFPALLAAQSSEQTRQLWSPELMMSKACDGIAAHYKLDSQQKEFTCKLLTERVTQFLDKHDKEIWPLLSDLTPFQLRGEQPDAATAKRVSERGHPIFEEARAEILRAQDEFRTILNDDQKKIHDRDLVQLKFQLQTIDRQFNDWRQGKIHGSSPLDSVRLAGGQRLGPERIIEEEVQAPAPSTTEWQRYVNDFIIRYKLDESQKKTALTILKDLEDQSAQYYKLNKKDLDGAETMLKRATTANPPDPKAVERARKVHQVLNKPFDDWFAALKERLERIPTEKQKAEQAAQAAQPAAQRPAPPAPPPPAPAPTQDKQDSAPSERPQPTPPAGQPQETPKPGEE